MSDYSTLTTSQASALLNVHESSIKRWCTEGDLVFDTTKGGHRRISIEDLLAFAESRSISCALSAFGRDALVVWNAVQLAHQAGDFGDLLGLAYRWIDAGPSLLLFRLVDFCIDRGMGPGRLFDDLIAPLLTKVGDEWHTGRLGIGDEHRITALLQDVLSRLRFTMPPFPADVADRVALVGCSDGNMHDMGAQAVRLVLEKQGWQVVYAGVNVPAHDYAKLQVRHKARLVCISVVLPSVPSDVHRMIDVLSRYYSPEFPYYLILGGNTLTAENGVSEHSAAFLGVKTCTAITAFEAWLKTIDTSDFEQLSV